MHEGVAIQSLPGTLTDSAKCKFAKAADLAQNERHRFPTLREDSIRGVLDNLPSVLHKLRDCRRNV